MELRELRYLIAVVEEGSISRAAERLQMTQPPLSTAITKLERSLSVALLDRHPKGVTATAAGAHLVDHARRLLTEIDQLADMVRAIGEGSQGTLSIAVTPANAWVHAPALLTDFARECSDTEVELVQEPPSMVIDAVRSRRVDAGLVYCAGIADLRRTHGTDLHITLFAVDPLVLVLPVNYPRTGRTLRLADLTSDRWVLPWTREGYPGLADLVYDSWRRAGISARTRNVGTLEEALPLVQAGLGVAVMPESVSIIAGDRVRTAQPKPGIGQLQSVLIWRRHEAPSPVLLRLLDVALDHGRALADSGLSTSS